MHIQLARIYIFSLCLFFIIFLFRPRVLAAKISQGRLAAQRETGIVSAKAAALVTTKIIACLYVDIYISYHFSTSAHKSSRHSLNNLFFFSRVFFFTPISPFASRHILFKDLLRHVYVSRSTSQCTFVPYKRTNSEGDCDAAAAAAACVCKTASRGHDYQVTTRQLQRRRQPHFDILLYIYLFRLPQDDTHEQHSNVY